MWEISVHMFGAGGLPALEYDLPVSKWFRIIFALVTLFLPISHQPLSHMKPNPPLVSIIITGNCDPTQGCDPAPAHLLVYCNLTVKAPSLWSLSHGFLVANAAAASTELCLALSTFPKSGAPASARFLLCWTSPESTILRHELLLFKSNWKDIVVYPNDRCFSQL